MVEERKLHNVTISLIGCSTPDWAMHSVTDKMFKGGFFGRLILCWREIPDRAYPRAEFLDPIVANSLATDLALISASDKKSFIFTKAADGWFETWYYENHDTLVHQTDNEMRGYLGRKHNHILSLAMVLALSEATLELTKAHLVKANEILEVEEKLSIERLLSSVGRHEDDEVAVKVMQKIHAWKYNSEANKKGEDITQSQLSRRTMYIVGNTDRLRKVLTSLEARGWIKIHHPKDARGATTYEVKNWYPGATND